MLAVGFALLPAVGYALLLPAVGYVLLGSFHHSPDLRCSSRAVLVSLLLPSLLLTTDSLAVVPSLFSVFWRRFFHFYLVVVNDSVVRFWLLPTPQLSIAPLRDGWFAVGALAPREGSLQQRGLLFVRIGFSWLKGLSRCSRAVSTLITKVFIAASDSGIVACFSVSVVSNTTVWSASWRGPMVRPASLAGHRSSRLKCLSLWSSSPAAQCHSHCG